MPDSIEAVIPGPMAAITNALLRLLLQSPFHTTISDYTLLIAFHGATTGKSYLVPLAYHRLGGVPTAFSAASWISALTTNPSLEIILQGVRQDARAQVVEDPNQVAEAMIKVLTAIGPEKASRFGLKVTGKVPPLHHVRKVMEGSKMLRLYTT
jgi:hypothetical protein